MKKSALTTSSVALFQIHGMPMDVSAQPKLETIEIANDDVSPFPRLNRRERRADKAMPASEGGRVSLVEKHMRPRFRATRVVDRVVLNDDPNTPDIDGTMVQHRWFTASYAAYYWIAKGVRERIRNRRVGPRFNIHDRVDCCASTEHDYYHNPCRWHDYDRYLKEVRRIARLIRHYDKRANATP